MTPITKDEVAVEVPAAAVAATGTGTGTEGSNGNSNDGANYRVISLAMDLTGKKLIDEICQISAFYDADNGRFSQYIMPHREISLSSIRNHGVKIVINSGYYRVMKNVFSQRHIRTRSEYVTLCDFIEWLKKVVAGFDGVIFAYHDVTPGSMRVTPYLLEALDRYKMKDEFFDIVKGFVNLTDVARTNADFKDKSLSFISMARRELKVDDHRAFLSAKRRAEMTYKLLTKLTSAGGDESTPSTIPVSKLLEFCSNKSEELLRLERQRELTRRVTSLKPIFLAHIRKNEEERNKAIILRRYLIDAALDYDTLKEHAGSGDSESIKELIAKVPAKSHNKKRNEEIEELIKLIMNYFTKKNDADADSGKGDSSIEKEKEIEMGQGDADKGLGKPRASIDSHSETEDDEEDEEDDGELDEFKEAREN